MKRTELPKAEGCPWDYDACLSFNATDAELLLTVKETAILSFHIRRRLLGLRTPDHNRARSGSPLRLSW